MISFGSGQEYPWQIVREIMTAIIVLQTYRLCLCFNQDFDGPFSFGKTKGFLAKDVTAGDAEGWTLHH
jgi:hypothetical protein